MPRTYGNCGPVVAATRGIELPRPSTPRLDIEAIRARATTKAAQVAEPVDVDQAPEIPAGPVVCDGCGVLVAAQYVARTGKTRHKPCQARAAGTGARAVREVA